MPIRAVVILLSLAVLAACGSQRTVLDPVIPVKEPAQVIVVPADVQLFPGDTQQFRAYGRTATGDSVGVSVTYSATGGTITPTGLFQAGAQAGAYQVVASLAAGAPSGTSAVAIKSRPRALTNECLTPSTDWIWCDDFDQDRLARYFEHDASNGDFVRMAGVGNAGSFGIRSRFAKGQVGAGALHLAFGRTPNKVFRPVDAGTADYREVYWRFYLRNAPGWVGGGGHKLARATSFVSPTSWAQAMIAHLWSGSSAPRSDALVLDPASGTDPAGNVVTTTYNDFAHFRWLGSVAGTTPLFAAANIGKWHCVEAHVRLNGAGQSDGAFEFWIDGHHEAGRTDLNWVGSFSGYGINAVFLESYWNDGAPAPQERYLDNFVVSTRPIGC